LKPDILKATYMFRVWNTESGGGPRRTKTSEAPDRYVKQVAERGERILRKGFLGAPLSREDIERLRDYLIYTAMKLTGARLLPFEVGASRGGHLPLTPRQEGPGFTLLSLEAALGRPTYTDELQQDDTAFLKPKGVVKLPAYMKPWSKHIWLTGRIKSVDDKAFVVTPELPATTEMIGYRSINAAADRAKLDTLAQTNLNALKQWIDDAESGAAYSFAVGDDVEFFINGREAEPSQFQVGDFVGVWYDLGQNPTQTIVKPIQIRSTRANTSAVKG